MNQARKSAVMKLPFDSVEFSMVQSLCTQDVDENVTDIKEGKWSDFRRVLLGVRIKSFN